MAVRKTAIAIPEELLNEIDRAAVERGESRSRYITNVLRQVVRLRRDADITRKLNEIHSEAAVSSEQLRGVEDLDGAWREEGW